MVRLLENAPGPSEPFAQFVEALADEIRDTGAVIQLVVLGDMVDVTQVLMGEDPDEALAASIVRFGRITAAHVLIFASLARFVAAGAGCTSWSVITTWDLAHPALQEQFLERLNVRADAAAASRSVTFHSWFPPFQTPSTPNTDIATTTSSCARSRRHVRSRHRRTGRHATCRVP
jgi:hypothetical protein